jgi:methyl-accepting chemotaxis protein
MGQLADPKPSKPGSQGRVRQDIHGISSSPAIRINSSLDGRPLVSAGFPVRQRERLLAAPQDLDGHGMFSKFSIRTKIVSIVCLLLFALAGMGLLAAKSMRSLNATTEDIASNWLPSVKALGELNAGVISYRAALRAHMLAETIEDKEAVEKALEKIVEGNTRIRKSYERMISSAEERALYDDWSKHWQDYKDMATKIMELSRKEAGHLPRAALDLNKQATKIGNEADAILRKDIDLNNKGADDETRTAADTYSSVLTMLAAIVGITVLLGAGISYYVIRDVSAGISAIVKLMRALG